MMGAASGRPGVCVLFLCCVLLVVAVGRAAADTVEYCNEVRALAAEGVADRPDVLYELALCSHWPMPPGPDGRRRADESLIAGLEETLALAPDYEPALDFMVHKVRTIGYGHGVDADALAGYATTLYGITGGLDAAEAVYEAALDGGDSGSAEAIRARVQRNLGLDALEYGPQRRQDSLALACSDGLFRLGIEGFCLSALETLAATAADNGETIPPDVLAHVGDAFRLLRFQALLAGSKEHNERELLGDRLVGVREMKQGARLWSILDGYPEPLRSPEHYRAHAAGAPSWGERIKALRRAVGIDGGNLKARCELAHGLEVTGSLDEARTLYADLGSADDQPCEAEAALREIEHAKTHGVLRLKQVHLDDPLTQPF